MGSFGRSSLNVLRGANGQAPVDASRRRAPAPLARVQAAMKKYQTLMTQNESAVRGEARADRRLWTKAAARRRE